MNISFLIGSGFSVPAGYPTASSLNERLSKIAASEISIYSGGGARFIAGPDPFALGMEAEKKFVEEFLGFYCREVLDPTRQFDYEDFYDYYKQFEEERKCSGSLGLFMDDFRKQNSIELDDHNLLFRFNNTFNHLLSDLLTKSPGTSHLSKPYDSNYGAFLQLVEALGATHKVHLHTLNHDLYMERLALSDSMQAGMDDGFEEAGSAFYGRRDIGDSQDAARLSRFTGRYDRRFCLYKLHGSVDFCWFRDGDTWQLLRCGHGMSPNEVYKEIVNDGRFISQTNQAGNFHPEFLSGRRSKSRRYDGEYYSKVLNHFSQNLTGSNALIVIGYGFRDEGINGYIASFLEDRKKIVFIVDVKRPETPLLERDAVFFVGGGVSGMDIKSILGNLKTVIY